MKGSTQTVYALRLYPLDDLKQSLLAFAKNKNLKAAYVITCVGSLEITELRLAGAKQKMTWNQKMEIVSLVGTLSHHQCHLHISLADETGKMVGGHLLDGCKINTTAEIILGEAEHLEFNREVDPKTGYLELQIKERT